MLEKCPICKARLKQSTSCRRCGAELLHLIELNKEAQQLYLRSFQLLERGYLKAAHRVAKRCIKIKAEPLYLVWCSFLEKRMELAKKGVGVTSYLGEAENNSRAAS